MRERQRGRLYQRAIWGGVFKEDGARQSAAAPMEFEGETLRGFRLNGQACVIAADVCKIAGLKNVSQAISRLDDDMKGITSNDTPGGLQSLVYVTEAGFYSLLLTFRLRKDSPRYEKLARFRRWVTGEVLPQIRETGRYVPRSNRVQREAKRLGCDIDTAKVRCEQFPLNSTLNREMADEGGGPRHLQNIHNAIHKGYLGNTAKGIRSKLGVKTWRKPIMDLMDAVSLSGNRHAKVLFLEKMRFLGPQMPWEARDKIAEQIAREIRDEDLRKLGPEFRIDIKNDPKRGPIIGVVRNEIAADPELAMIEC